MSNADEKRFVLSGKQAASGMAWLVKPTGGEICIEKLSDDELYQKCRQYGMNAKVWLRKFAGLLPEVAKRGLHRRKGFISIQEFAGKLAGMSEYAVDKILNLAKNLENKPALKKLFESGAEGWSKIEKVAYLATTETDKNWADKVMLLSTRALEALVQNNRSNFTHVSEKENNSLFSQAGGKGESGVAFGGEITGFPFGVGDLRQMDGSLYEPPVRFSFPASKEVEFDLRLAKQKLEKQSKQVLSWNETFKMLVQKSDLATGKNGGLTAAEGKTSLEGGGVGFCLKCHKKADIRNVQICDKCIKFT